MGLGGISIWQLLIVLAIVVLLFGTKRLRTLGTDLGGAIKGFRKSMNSEPEDSDADAEPPANQQKTAAPDDNKKSP
jgi:sec-independent protein translocase protein TatA